MLGKRARPCPPALRPKSYVPPPAQQNCPLRSGAAPQANGRFRTSRRGADHAYCGTGASGRALAAGVGYAPNFRSLLELTYERSRGVSAGTLAAQGPRRLPGFNATVPRSTATKQPSFGGKHEEGNRDVGLERWAYRPIALAVCGGGHFGVRLGECSRTRYGLASGLAGPFSFHVSRQSTRTFNQ
jgi:hypothetical protein